MDTPFPYSQYVTGKNFVGRKTDVTLLGNMISQGEHVVIYEPPKTGKTSLVQQTLFNMKMMGKSFVVGQMSALNIRTADEFLLRMGSTAVKMAGSTPEEYASVVEQYLGGTHFVFDRQAFAERGEVLSLSWAPDREDAAALLAFPFRLAEEKGMQMFLIIDDFHCLLHLDNPDVVFVPLNNSMKEARENGLRKFSYIILGSGVNAMHDIFRSSLLFHRQVERVKLSPIDPREMSDHVLKGFLSGGKVVSIDLLMGACNLFKGHPWYINQLASICDAMTRGYIMEPVLVDALNCLIALHEPRFQAVVNDLTTHQVSLLRATVDGVTRLSSADIIRRYGLNSSANVKRVKDALCKKEVLVFDEDDTPSIIDPLFEYWVKKYFFELSV